LNVVIVQGYKNNESSVKQLPDVHQNFIVAGKKNEVISVQDLDANVSEKTGRQIFSKIANAIGGIIGKLRYYAYYQKRVSDGYRKNASSDAEAQFMSLEYLFNSNVKLKAELGRSTYLYRSPGPLTDAMFTADPRQSTRNRNYFSPDIFLPSLSLDWRINETTHFNWTNSAVLGNRSSVQLIALADIKEDLTKNRQVDVDNFNSYTSELKLKKLYSIGSLSNVLVGGIRYINNDLHRQQLGKGTGNSDYDLSITGTWGRDLHFKTQNVASFLENLIYFNPKLSVSPAFRIESGVSNVSGMITYLASEKVPNEIKYFLPFIWN